MILRKYISLISITLALLTLCSCKDDLFGNGSADDGSRSEMTLKLDVDVPWVDFRTRADGMDNSQVRSLWVGVYDIITGNRVGSEHFNYPASPVELPVLYYDAHPTVAIVGVANYRGLTDWENNDLTALLDNAETWNDFVNINVRVPLENGSPVADENNPPVMMGLLTGPDSGRPFYTTEESGKVSIQNATGYEINLSPNSLYGSMIKQIEGKKIYLKRLFSKLNVTIKTGSNASVTNVSFHRGNMPMCTYLTEHPIYVNDQNNVKSWKDFSSNTPNYADKVLTVNGGKVEGSDSYKTDDKDYWIPASTNNTFSFTHYENKHWGVKSADGYFGREKYLITDNWKREEQVLECLGHGYNNFASYFVVKMTILDKGLNRSAEVQYVIHEGNCNDSDGNLSSFDNNNDASQDSSRDYASFRNMVYNYNITVNGIYDIITNVSGTDDHHDSMSGTIWTAQIEDIYDDPNNYPQRNMFNFGSNPNRVLRLYVGRGPDLPPLDYIYGNVPEDIAGMYWPELDYNNLVPISQFNRHFNFWKDNTIFTSVEDFVKYLTTGGGGYFSLRAIPYSMDDQWYPEAYRIGIYWYDPDEKGNLSGLDKDKCTGYTNKVCHGLEWMPGQKIPGKLAQPDYGSLPSMQNILKYVTEGIDIDLTKAHENCGNNNKDIDPNDFQYYLTIFSMDQSKPFEKEYLVGNDYKCHIPLSDIIQYGNSFGYYVYAKALNKNKYLDSEKIYCDPSQGNNRGISLVAPGTWDFSTNGFNDWFTSNFPLNYQNSDKVWFHRASGDILKEWKNGLNISLTSGKDMNITTQTKNNVSTNYLYFNNSGNGNGLKIKVYQTCTITVVVYTSSSSRTLNVSGGNPSEIPWTGASTETTLTSKVIVEDGGSQEISLYFSGGGAYYKSVTLSD